MAAKFEVRSFNHVGINSTYFPKNYGSRYPGHAPFSKNFSGVMFRLSLGTCLPNLKSVTLNVLVLHSGYQLQHKIDGPKFTDPSIAAVSP